MRISKRLFRTENKKGLRLLKRRKPLFYVATPFLLGSNVFTAQRFKQLLELINFLV